MLGTIPAVSTAADEEPDWAATTADTIERVVGSVRAKTADPLEKVVRVVVYGVLAAIVGLAAVVLVAVAVVRGLVVLIDLVWTREVWLAHLLTGGIFTAVGLLTWRRRTTKSVKV